MELGVQRFACATLGEIKQVIAARVAHQSVHHPQQLPSDLGKLFFFLWGLADRHGVDWFAAAGSELERNTALALVSARPARHEVE